MIYKIGNIIDFIELENKYLIILDVNNVKKKYKALDIIRDIISIWEFDKTDKLISTIFQNEI